MSGKCCTTFRSSVAYLAQLCDGMLLIISVKLLYWNQSSIYNTNRKRVVEMGTPHVLGILELLPCSWEMLIIVAFRNYFHCNFMDSSSHCMCLGLKTFSLLHLFGSLDLQHDADNTPFPLFYLGNELSLYRYRQGKYCP